MKKNVLVLCTGNSCRSQMAEGYLRHFAGDKARIYSAGIEAHGLNPGAVATMLEDGIDISGQTSNRAEEYLNLDFDCIITVCDNARERCPYFPAQTLRLHHSFEDPAKAIGAPEQIRAEFARIRDQIKEYCRRFVQEYL